MPSGDAEQVFQVFPVFVGVWVMLGLFSFGFFDLNKNARLKRRFWPPFVIAVGILFVGFGLAMGIPSRLLPIVVTAVLGITLLNLRSVKFCDSCGATIMDQNPFSRARYCSKCGAGLAQS